MGIIITCNCKKLILKWVNQLKKILYKHKIIDCKPAPTSIKTCHLEYFSSDYQPKVDFYSQLQSIVGFLKYAIIENYPNIA